MTAICSDPPAGRFAPRLSLAKRIANRRAAAESACASFRLIGAMLITFASVGELPKSSRAFAQDRELATPVEYRRALQNWEQQRAAVKSMVARGNKFVGGVVVPEDRFSQHEFTRIVREGLIAGVDFGVGDVGIDRLAPLTAPFFIRQSDEARPNHAIGTWRPISFVEDSGTIRVDDGHAERLTTTVRRGTMEERYESGIKQATVFGARSGLVVESIDTFLFRPPLQRAADWRYERAESGLSRLTSDRSMLEFDGTTGFVTHYVEWRSDGTLAFERIQAEPVLTPLGIPIPRLIAQAKYRPFPADPLPLVQSMKVYVVNSVELNPEIHPARFKLSVPARTRVVKFEGGDPPEPAHEKPSKRPAVERPMTPVDDVARFANATGFGRKAPRNELPVPEGTAKQNRPLRGMLIWVNVFALAAIVIWRAFKTRIRRRNS